MKSKIFLSTLIVLSIVGFIIFRERIEFKTYTSANQITKNYGGELVGFVDGSIGYDHSFIVNSKGMLFSIGNGTDGKTCLGNTDAVSKWTRVVDSDGFINGESKVKQVFAGYLNSFVLLENGILYTCGSNENGRSGLVNTANVNTLTKVVDGPTTDNENQFINDGRDKVIQVSTYSINNTRYSNHTLILTESGKVYAFGSNENGKTGLGTTTGDTLTPTLISNGDNGFVNGTAIKISTGASHSLVVTNDGIVYSFGQNQDGRTGLGTTSGTQSTPKKVLDGNAGADYFRNGDANFKVIDIVASDRESLILTEKGVVYSFGFNRLYGAQGIGGNNSDQTRPIKVYDNDGFINLNVDKIAAGNSSRYALKDGIMYSWGRNDSGQLGLGTTVDSNLPKKVLGSNFGFTNSNIKSISAGSVAIQIFKNDATTYNGGLEAGDIFVSEYSNNNAHTYVIDNSKHYFPKVTINGNTLNNTDTNIYYNSDIDLSEIETSSLAISDITLNGDSIKNEYNISNSYVIDTDGDYEIVVEDIQGFIVKVNFNRDTTLPTIKISYLNSDGENVFEEFNSEENIRYINFDLSFEVIEANINLDKSTTMPIGLTANKDNEGRYLYKIEDKAGHIITLIVVVDVTNPQILTK